MTKSAGNNGERGRPARRNLAAAETAALPILHSAMRPDARAQNGPPSQEAEGSPRRGGGNPRGRVGKSAGSAPDTNRCRVCGSPVEPSSDAFPFCSRRCRLVDLGRWFSGKYQISRPLDPQDEDDEGMTG